MRTTTRKLAAVAALALVGAACGSDEASDSATESTDTVESTESAATTSDAGDTATTTAGDEPAGDAGDFDFILVTPSPLGDGSFIDASARGVDRAIDELGVDGTIVESQSAAEQEASLRSALNQSPDLVLALGLETTTVTALADEFPDMKIAVPSDFFADEVPDNVAALQVNTHEASFLAGLIAGSLTETNTVGAVLGGDAPGINQFFLGYKQGVLEACPDCEVLNSYLDFNFSDPTIGKEAALAQYDQGADIIYGVAGLSGQGVLQAAAEEGKFAIGVDSNQDDDQPGNVIVSVMKRVDETTYIMIEDALNGEFESGFRQVGMADGAAGLSWSDGSTTFADNGPAEMVDQLPDVDALVEDYRAQILDGSYVVCDALNDPDADVCEGL